MNPYAVTLILPFCVREYVVCVCERERVCLCTRRERNVKREKERYDKVGWVSMLFDWSVGCVGGLWVSKQLEEKTMFKMNLFINFVDIADDVCVLPCPI